MIKDIKIDTKQFPKLNEIKMNQVYIHHHKHKGFSQARQVPCMNTIKVYLTKNKHKTLTE